MFLTFKIFIDLILNKTFQYKTLWNQLQIAELQTTIYLTYKLDLITKVIFTIMCLMKGHIFPVITYKIISF